MELFFQSQNIVLIIIIVKWKIVGLSRSLARPMKLSAVCTMGTCGILSLTQNVGETCI